jgi:hypothetical protein
MSLSQETMMELMSLADGELEGDAKARVEKLLAESEEVRRAFDGLRAPHLGLWLSDSLVQRADKAGADGIADAVMGAIAAGGSAPASIRAGGAGADEARPSGTVVRLDASRRGKIAPASRSSALVVAFVGAAALAAGVALFVKSTTRPGEPMMPVASVGTLSPDMQRPPTEPSALGVEVDDIDSPSRGISVFEISLAGAGAAANVGAASKSGSSVVVWIDDEGAK